MIFMSKRTTKTELSTGKVTCAPAITKEDAKKEFQRRMKHKEDASCHSELSRFLRVMDAVLEMKGDGFTVKDVFYFSQPWLLQPKTVLELWEHWRTTMIALNKLQAVESCMDDQMFAAVR